MWLAFTHSDYYNEKQIIKTISLESYTLQQKKPNYKTRLKKKMIEKITRFKHDEKMYLKLKWMLS